MPPLPSFGRLKGPKSRKLNAVLTTEPEESDKGLSSESESEFVTPARMPSAPLPEDSPSEEPALEEEESELLEEFSLLLPLSEATGETSPDTAGEALLPLLEAPLSPDAFGETLADAAGELLLAVDAPLFP